MRQIKFQANLFINNSFIRVKLAKVLCCSTGFRYLQKFTQLNQSQVSQKITNFYKFGLTNCVYSSTYMWFSYYLKKYNHGKASRKSNEFYIGNQFRNSDPKTIFRLIYR